MSLKTAATLVFSLIFLGSLFLPFQLKIFFEGTFSKKRDTFYHLQNWASVCCHFHIRVKKKHDFVPLLQKKDDIFFSWDLLKQKRWLRSFSWMRCHQKPVNVRNQLSGSPGLILFTRIFNSFIVQSSIVNSPTCLLKWNSFLTSEHFSRFSKKIPDFFNTHKPVAKKNSELLGATLTGIVLVSSSFNGEKRQKGP